MALRPHSTAHLVFYAALRRMDMIQRTDVGRSTMRLAISANAEELFGDDDPDRLTTTILAG